MSGTTNICLQQQFHNATGEPLVGGLLYSRMAGTLTPQPAFRTAALTPGSEYPNPVVLDASARVPMMFYADGLVRLILTDKNGIAQFDYDNVPVVGSSSGGPASDTTDVTRLYSTGDMKIRYGVGAITGYVRANGRTIGPSGTPATEYAGDDAQALFEFLWNGDPSLTVLPSRGVNAHDDWLALRQIATPDFRGISIAGLDGMGNTLANRLANTFGANRDVLGAMAGTDTTTIGVTNLPAHKHKVLIDIAVSGGASVTVPAHSHPIPNMIAAGVGVQPAGGSVPYIQSFGSNYATSNSDELSAVGISGGTGTVNGDTNNEGGSNPIAHVPPTKLITVYIRL